MSHVRKDRLARLNRLASKRNRTTHNKASEALMAKHQTFNLGSLVRVKAEAL